MKKIIFIIILFFSIGCHKNEEIIIPSGIEGITMINSEMIIPNVKVWIKNNEIGDEIIAITYSDCTGYYKLTNILPGSYQVYGYAAGYDTTIYAVVNVIKNTITNRDINLFFHTY